MSIKSIFQQVAGLESQGDDLEVVVATAEEAAEAVVGEEIAVVEKAVEENTSAVVAAETAIDAVEERIEELEEEVAGLENMLNGSTPFNAGLFDYRFKQASKISERFGKPVEHMGAESFVDASTAQLNALAGLENMKSSLVTAGNAIKQFFINLYKGFIAVITGLFDRFKGLEKKAALKKSRVVAKEKFDGKVKLAASSNLLDGKGQAAAVTAAVVTASGALSSSLNQLGAVTTKDAIASAVAGVVDALTKAGSKLVKASTETAETLEVKINNSVVTVVAPKTDAGLAEVSFSVAVGKEGKEVDSASKSELLAVCNAVIADAVKLRPAKLDAKALTATRDQAIASLEKRAAEEDAGKDEKKKLVGYIRAGHRAALKLGSGSLKLAGDVLAAQLSFVEAHL